MEKGTAPPFVFVGRLSAIGAHWQPCVHPKMDRPELRFIFVCFASVKLPIWSGCWFVGPTTSPYKSAHPWVRAQDLQRRMPSFPTAGRDSRLRAHKKEMKKGSVGSLLEQKVIWCSALPRQRDFSALRSPPLHCFFMVPAATDVTFKRLVA
ncbi:hypothetical protein TW95_gp0860 [Pandoravirus inopinatum]|uniref:Uncharacterized protein n=1 Tax=Pandoravirus inopinatum TaxID=1605721 RepID=A0A0B5J223_9VIRU|nr:hypothetical protein TW95_gp0860 [Pandoravirus inopinatum]AJF97594.1 hypothetical protein [Pandoravirus inopinatum]